MTVQGWYQSERGTMCFQQCDVNLPQIVNHLANYIDLTQIMKCSKLNAHAQPYAPNKENLNVHNDENNNTEKEQQMNKSKENKEEEETKDIKHTLMPWITVNQKGVKKLTNDNNNKKESWHNPHDVLQHEEVDDSWSEWDEDNLEIICKENEENKDNKKSDESECHIDNIEPNLFQKIT